MQKSQFEKTHTLDKRNSGKKVAAGGARSGEREREKHGCFELVFPAK